MLDTVAGMVREQLDEQDDVGLINFYAENNTQFHELTSTISSLSQDLPLVSTRKCYLDVDAANAQISSLQGLHLLIAGLTNESPPYSAPDTPHKQNSKTPAKPPSARHSQPNGTSPTSKTPARPSSQNRPRVAPSPNRPSSSTSLRK